MNQHDEVRTTVEAVHDQETGQIFLRGTETADKNRANVFGVWRKEEPNPHYGFDYDGRYHEARPSSSVGVEVEARFAFADHEDISDHAEVYLWQAYGWDLTKGAARCQKDKTFAGEYVVEAGGLEGPFAIYSPLVGAAVERIQQARRNQEMTPRIVGSPERQSSKQETNGVSKPRKGKQSAAKASAKNQPPGAPIRRSKTCLALYIFNSNKISEHVSNAYGWHCQAALREAFAQNRGDSAARKAPGTPLPRLRAKACHGDLFGDARMLLGDWLLYEAYGIDDRSLDAELAERLKNIASISYVPYAVGIGKIAENLAQGVHGLLESQEVIGYRGLVTFSEPPSLEPLADALHLIDLSVSQVAGAPNQTR